MSIKIITQFGWRWGSESSFAAEARSRQMCLNVRWAFLFSNGIQRSVYGVVASRRVLCTLHIVVFSCFISFFFSVGKDILIGKFGSCSGLFERLGNVYGLGYGFINFHFLFHLFFFNSLKF